MINTLPSRASWIRTSECRSQSPVPYRLAIALNICYQASHTAQVMCPARSVCHKGGYWDSNPGPPEPQSGALTNCAISTIHKSAQFTVLKTYTKQHFESTVPEGIRTPDTRLRRPLLYPTELLALTLA